MTDERTRKQLTAAEFIDIWSGGYKGVKEEDGLGYWESKIFDESLIIFDHIEIKDQFIIIDTRQGLPNISLRNAKTNELYFVSTKTGFINIESKSRLRNIYILQQSTIGDIKINESDTGHLTIGSGSKAGNIHLDNNSNAGDIRVESNSTIGSIVISNKSIIDDIKLDNDSKTGSIHLNSQSQAGEINIKKVTIVDSLNVTGQSKIYSLNIQSKELRRIVLYESYIQKFLWNQETLCILSVDGCQIETLEFKRSVIPRDSVFQFGDCRIGTFRCEQLVNTAWFNIYGLIPLIGYERFVAEDEKYPMRERVTKKYIFESSKQIQNTTLILVASDLGKTTFVDCRLDQFDKFIFYNTKLLEVFIAGTPLPKQVSLPASKTARYEQNDQERLAFGQFKRIYENRGDTVSAADYLALEMDAYHRYLKQPEVVREKGGTKAERFTIWLNKISNNHGTDWLRAVGVTLGVNGIMFAIYCYFLGYEPYVPFYSKIDWHTTLNLFSYSFEFLNPLRKADFLDKVNLEPVRDRWDWVARFWDYVSRIVVAYFVYQTVQAFRRYGKTK